MNLGRHFASLLPIALFACATSGEIAPEIARDHPAHPEAAAAQVVPFSSALAMDHLDRTKTPADSGRAPAMSLDQGGREAPPEGTKQVTLYTCPMDPEVVQDKPGDCPICGMRLKPMTAETDEKGGAHEHDHE